MRAREDGFIRSSALLSQPLFEKGGDIRPEGRASHLPSFSEAAEMSTDTELHIFTPKRCNLAVTKTSLNREQQKRSVPSSNPSFRIGSCEKSGGLFLGQKLHWSPLIALCRNGQHTLTMQCQSGFRDRNILKKRMYRRETVVSGPRLIAAAHFEMIEKLPQQSDIEIFYPYFRWRTF
jgi:hypothetical protein